MHLWSICILIVQCMYNEILKVSKPLFSSLSIKCVVKLYPFPDFHYTPINTWDKKGRMCLLASKKHYILDNWVEKIAISYKNIALSVPFSLYFFISHPHFPSRSPLPDKILYPSMSVQSSLGPNILVHLCWK